MPSIRADAGLASRLDGLPVDLKEFRVQGNGCLRIDEDQHPPRMTWIASPEGGLTILSQNDDRVVEEKLQSIVAVGGAYRTSGEFNTGRNEETQHERAYMVRLRFLQDEAVLDGYTLSATSEIDFWQFVRSEPDVRQGNLVLMDNGNVRAIWKDNQGTRLGLQFLGDGLVQFVIFKRRNQGQPISRVSGRDSLEGVRRQIVAFELESFLYA